METFRHTNRALAEWHRTYDARWSVLEQAKTDEDVAAWERNEKVCADAVREAFFLDTAAYNEFDEIMASKLSPFQIAEVVA